MKVEKVKQKPQFEPIQITLETEDERSILYKALSYFQMNIIVGKSSIIDDLIVKLMDLK